MKKNNKNLDLFSIITPIIIVVLICISILIFPNALQNCISAINNTFGKQLTLIYIYITCLYFILTIYIAFSKYGNIVLGDKNDKPSVSFWGWGAMMFCCGIAGDLIYFSFTDWIAYANDPYIQSLGSVYDNAIVHAGYIWTYFWMYFVVAIALGFSMHVRKRTDYKFGEALRPLFGKSVDTLFGKIINVFVLFILIIGVACAICFSVPVITSCICTLLNIQYSKYITLIFMILICGMYTCSVLNGLKGMEFLSKICMYIYILLLLYVVIFGGEAINIINGTSRQIILLGKRFIPILANFDKKMDGTFTQDYMTFYIAYWIAWAITTPFFIAIISKGKKIRDVILGGFLFTMPGVLVGFFVFPNFAISKQVAGTFDFISLYNNVEDKFDVIAATISQLPLKGLAMLIMVTSLICFISTSLDSLSYSCAYFSYKKITADEIPGKKIRLLWAIILMLLPIFITISSMNYSIIQDIVTLSGILAYGLIILLVISFFKDANQYLKGK